MVAGLGQVTMTGMQCTNSNVGCKIVIIPHYHTKQYPLHTQVGEGHIRCPGGVEESKCHRLKIQLLGGAAFMTNLK